MQFAMANFLPSMFVLKLAITAVTTPPTLVPKVAAKAFSNPICPLIRAEMIMAKVAWLD